jgi:sec-independent protein translocase protein TatC
VVLVGLNVIGVLPAQRLLAGWRIAVVFIFVFAAVATPTADPFTMFVFAAPLTFLYFAAWFVARLLDKRKEKARPDWLDVDDNQASPL